MTSHHPSPDQQQLHKKLGVLDIWALGVGIVVCGQYFGWNLGLADNGPIAMLVASLLVCLLFLGWVLTLAELAVAMPHAGGPLAYGERAGGPWLGFTMAWFMLLECLFGMIATALASGWYIAILFNPDHPEQEPAIIIGAGLATVVVFFLLQAWGVKEQSVILVLMTYAAIGGLVLFWVVSATNFSLERVWSAPVLGEKGWRGVLDAVPYALWWLIIIEGVSLAAEETKEPARTIPRGLVLGMMTIIALIALTVVLGCAAMPWQEIDGDYPLAKIVHHALAGQFPIVLFAFGAIGIFGLIASYHGLLYSTSRQLFALGRAGYLPAALGRLHAGRRTPVLALLACSGMGALFVIASVWFRDAINVAILVAGLASLLWYVLAMACLGVLRRREPRMFENYRAPLTNTLPIMVVVLSIFAIVVYTGIEHAGIVMAFMAVLYVGGLAYFRLGGRTGRRPFETAKLMDASAQSHRAQAARVLAPWRKALDWITVCVLWGSMLMMAWIVFAAFLPHAARFASDEIESSLVILIVTAALVLVCVIAWLQTRPQTRLTSTDAEKKVSG